MIADYLAFKVENGNERTALANSMEEEVNRKFDTEQFQLKFHLKNDLTLETTDWLSSPVFIQADMKILLHYEGYIISKHPADCNTILIKDSKSKEVIRKSILYVRGEGRFEKDGINDLHCSGGRLAANIGGRVYIFDFQKLVEGASRFSAKLLEVSNEMEIHYVFLNENFFLCVHGTNIMLYNFWKFKPTPLVKDFIL